MILLSGAIFCAGHFVERRESMQTNNKMAVAPVGKLIWQMSIPPLISMFLQYSYNLIDSAFVARLSENALIAVSLAFPITTLMNAASIWIGVGVNVLIAGYLGQKKQDEANATVTHGLLLAFGIGALLNLMSLLIMKLYFRAFTNNEEIYQLSIAYMSVCSFMQIPNMVHIAIQKMIQATGNMVAPMWFQIAGVVVNFVFDPILIFGIGIFPAMGIRGAGNRYRSDPDACDLSGHLLCAAHSRAYPQAAHSARQKDGHKAVFHRHSRNPESCTSVTFDFGAQCDFGRLFRGVYPGFGDLLQIADLHLSAGEWHCAGDAPFDRL